MPKKAIKRKAARHRTKRHGSAADNGGLLTAFVISGIVILAGLAYVYGWGPDSLNIADFKFELPPGLGLPQVPQTN